MTGVQTCALPICRALEQKVTAGKAANQSAEAAVETEIGRKDKQLDQQYQTKTENLNWANEAFGTDGVSDAIKKGAKKPGATGKW